MANEFHIQYQGEVIAPPGAFTAGSGSIESSYHQPWTEPVRLRIIPALAIALAASGLFAPVLAPNQEPGATNEAPWHQQWSVPVRIKPALRTAANPFLFYTPGSGLEPGPGYESQWHYPWSEPVRLKPGLRPYLQQSFTNDTVVLPERRQLEWFTWLSEPVRLPKGLKVYLQQFLASEQRVLFGPDIALIGYNNFSLPVWPKKGLSTTLQQFLAAPPRLLPNPNVTLVMAATETNNDVFLGGIYVYTPSPTPSNQQLANVAIVEVPIIAGGAVSIEVKSSEVAAVSIEAPEAEGGAVSIEDT